MNKYDGLSKPKETMDVMDVGEIIEVRDASVSSWRNTASSMRAAGRVFKVFVKVGYILVKRIL